MQSKIILLQFVVELRLPILTTHAYMAYTIHINVYEEQHACGGGGREDAAGRKVSYSVLRSTCV